MNQFLFELNLGFSLATCRYFYYILNSKYVFSFEKFITYMSHFDVECFRRTAIPNDQHS